MSNWIETRLWVHRIIITYYCNLLTSFLCRNVDIWMAGLAEDHMNGSRLGPTFTCMLSRQFKFLRNGDKFYYENPDVFTEAQVIDLNLLRSIKYFCNKNNHIRDVCFVVVFNRMAMFCSFCLSIAFFFYWRCPKKFQKYSFSQFATQPPLLSCSDQVLSSYFQQKMFE